MCALCLEYKSVARVCRQAGREAVARAVARVARVARASRASRRMAAAGVGLGRFVVATNSIDPYVVHSSSSRSLPHLPRHAHRAHRDDAPASGPPQRMHARALARPPFPLSARLRSRNRRIASRLLASSSASAESAASVPFSLRAEALRIRTRAERRGRSVSTFCHGRPVRTSTRTN